METTGAIAAVTDDVPPSPDVKPKGGPVEPVAKSKRSTSKASTKSAKRAFRREVNRLRRLFSD